MKPLLLLSGLFLLASCSAPAEHAAPAGTPATTLKATLAPLGGSGVTGTVTFTTVGSDVLVEAFFEGLGDGPHGFHIHEFGDCSAADGSSAGGHFNPEGHPHSSPDAGMRHMGDLGNIQGVAGATTRYTFTDGVIDLALIAGRSVVVHGGEDDLTSQPAGNAGPRIACGVIGVVK